MLPRYADRWLWAGCLVALLSGCATVGGDKAATASGEGSAVPRHLSSDYRKAGQLMEQEEYAAAVPVLEGVVKRYPREAGPRLNLGIALRHTGDLEGALQVLQAAVERAPADAAVQHQLGIVHRERGEFGAAEAAYRRALALREDYALAHCNLGILLDLYLNRPTEALPHYRRYQALLPEPDRQVNGWIVELERRTSAQARAAR